MKELKCENCGSSEMKYENGIWICKSCESRFIPDKNEIPVTRREEQLEDVLCDICEEIASTSEFDDTDYDQREKLFKKLDLVADEIIVFNKNNPYAMTAKMLIQINEGLRDKAAVNRFVEYIERAVNNSDDEAKNNTWETFGNHLARFMSKILSVDPDLEDRVYSLVEALRPYI